jgi:gamma-glutamyltranspeptidase/glutathione hydrolase
MREKLLLIGLVAALAGCTTASNFRYQVPEQPEGSSAYTEKPGWSAQRFAVAAANPLATDAFQWF